MQDVGNYSCPAIYGNRIVWSANYNESTYNYSIYMRDISTSTQAWIAEGESPDIYDTKIVYSANGRSTRDIFIYDITTKKIELISPYSSDLSYPQMYGNKVIWSNFFSRGGFIEMYDFVTNETIDVTSDNAGNTLYGSDTIDAGDDTGTHVDISGDKIVYSKSGDDQFGYAGVYVYDIPSAKSTPVYIYPRGTHTTPDIYNDTIVWGIDSSYGGGNDTGIYICNLSVTNTLPPVAEFTANTTYGAAPLVVLFTDTSTGGVPTSWLWDFGDRIDSKHTTNATHTFTKLGNYTISLIAGNDAGNSKVMKPNYIVVINPLPVANFSSNVTYGYPPLSIQFTDLSQNATGWNWDFGDGSNSTQRNPVHEYLYPGIYSVNLTATNENGTDSKLTTITVMQPVGIGPYAYITNSGDNTVSVIDTATNKVTAMIPVGDDPRGIAASPDGKKVYVIDGGGISIIDTVTNTVTATVDVESSFYGIVVNPAGTKVYVAGGNFVSVIDTATNKVTATIPVGNSPSGVAVIPDGSRVYVANLLSDNVSVIDTSTNKVTATMNVGSGPISFGQFIGSFQAQPIFPVADFNINVTEGYAPDSKV